MELIWDLIPMTAVVVFLFWYNTLAMRRSELRKLEFQLRTTLQQRRKLAGAPELPDAETTTAEAFAADALLTMPDAEEAAELFRLEGETLEFLRDAYNRTAERSNPLFRNGFGRFFRFQEWPLL